MTGTLTRDDWQKRADALALRSGAYINGSVVEAVSGKTFDNYSPTTGGVLNEVAATDAADVDRAVEALARPSIEGTGPVRPLPNVRRCCSACRG